MGLGSLPPRLRDLFKRRDISALYPPQEAAVEAGIFEGANVLMTTATASGKTLLAEIAAVDAGMRGEMTLFAVPLKALAYEKRDGFARYEDLVRVAASTGEYDVADARLGDLDVLVVTYEKLDSLLRHRPRWLGRVGLIVLDEVHYVGDYKRGPVLESIVAKAKYLGIKAQIIASSATVGNPEDLAKWLEAKLVKSDWRPVPLKEGVYWGPSVQFSDGSDERIEWRGSPEVSLALDTIESGGQALIFVHSRSAAVKVAEEVAEAMAKDGDPELAERLRGTAMGEGLARLAVRGVAYHHGGLGMRTRRLVEEGFRSGALRVVVATTTLAVGVNLPARRVIIDGIRRFDLYRGEEEIPVMEYRQMAGRAGRPGLDSYGEAVVVAQNRQEAQHIAEKYIKGAVEPVRSRLFSDGNLGAHLLGVVGSGYVETSEEAARYLGGTLAGAPPLEYVEKALGELAAAGFLEDLGPRYVTTEQWGVMRRAGRRYRPTRLGELATRLYVDPWTAAEYIRLMRALRRPSAFAYILIIVKAPDVPKAVWARLDRRDVAEAVSSFDGMLFGPYFAEEVKTAAMLRDWADEVGLDALNARYGVGPGDIRIYVDLFKWLGPAAARLAEAVGLEERASGILTASRRVIYGVRKELLELASGLRGVGRARLRVLYNAGYRTLDDVTLAYPDELAKVMGIGRELAERIIRDAMRALASKGT